MEERRKKLLSWLLVFAVVTACIHTMTMEVRAEAKDYPIYLYIGTDPTENPTPQEDWLDSGQFSFDEVLYNEISNQTNDFDTLSVELPEITNDAGCKLIEWGIARSGGSAFASDTFSGTTHSFSYSAENITDEFNVSAIYDSIKVWRSAQYNDGLYVVPTWGRNIEVTIDDGNGSTSTESFVQSETAFAAEVTLPEPARNGYNLTGWLMPDQKTIIQAGETVDFATDYCTASAGTLESYTVTAQWEPVPEQTFFDQSGTYELKAGTAYTLAGAGSWTVGGDSSTYPVSSANGQQFYVKTDGSYALTYIQGGN